MKGSCRSGAALLGAMLVWPGVSSGKVVFSDDFNGASVMLTFVEGWSGAGPEIKEYNAEGTGQLVVKDENGSEKETGAHKGYFDTVEKLFPGVSLKNEGDWLQLSVDLAVFSGSWSGAGIKDHDAGLRVALTDSSQNERVADSGYGVFLATGIASTHTLQEMKKPVAAQQSLGAVLKGYDPSENNDLLKLVLRFERQANGSFKIDGSYGGHPFAPVTATNADINDNTFDTLGISVGMYDMGLKIDNLVIATNCEESGSLGLIGN